MGMIQGIDGMALINAFRAGKQDRASANEIQIKQDEAQAKVAREKETRGLMGQLFGGAAPAGGGVAGQFGIGRTPINPDMTPGGGIGGGIAQERARIDAEAPPKMPDMGQEPPRAAYDPNILQKLVMLDPETGGKVASALKTMDEINLKRHQEKNDILGAAAHVLAKVAPAERARQLAIMAPQLKAMGWSDQELANANLSDEGLRAYQGTAIDFDKMIDNELAERKFMAGDNVAVVAGGNVANIKPDGSAKWIVGGGGAPSSEGLPRPQGKADVDALPPGTQFIAPDGTIRTKPGGGGSNVTGGFRP